MRRSKSKLQCPILSGQEPADRSSSCRYGPFTLAIATLLGLAAYSSARTPLRDMVSWIPLFICLLVLLTVFFLPRLYQTLQGADPNISMEEGHAGFILDHFGEPMETTSRRGSHRGGRLRETHFRELDISNMGRPTSRLSNALSIHESDIDLQDSAEIMRIALRRMVGPIRNNHFEETSSGASLDGSRRSDFAAHQSSTHTSQDRNYSTRSSSPESSGSPSPSSANSEADELLQG